MTRDEAMGALCVAELARSNKYSETELPDPAILEEARRAISSAREYCGGRMLALDARRKVFETLYRPAGFVEVRKRPSPNEGQDEAFVTACCNIKDW